MKPPLTAASVRMARLVRAALALAVVVLPTSPARTQQADRLAVQRALDGFLENRGQWPTAYRFGGWAGPLSIAVTSDSICTWTGETSALPLLAIELGTDGAASAWSGDTARPGRRHVLKGSSPEAWQSDLTAFSSLRRVGSDGGTHRITVGEGQATWAFHPGAVTTAASIRLRSPAAARMRLEAGTLCIETERGVLRVSPRRPSPADGGLGGPPWRFGEVDATGTSLVECEGALLEGGLDASLTWSSYLGGSSSETVDAVTVDETGAVYVVGTTKSVDFPVTPDAFDSTLAVNPVTGAAGDAYIARFAPDGASLEYSTFFGGGGGENPSAVELTASGSVTVIGWTGGGLDFPTTPNAFKTTLASQDTDAFVTRFTPEGDGLVFSTLLGGSKPDTSRSGVLLPDGSTVVVGNTSSPDFPTTIGPGSLGSPDAFVTRVSADGSALVFSRLLSGSSSDNATAVGWAAGGRVLVGGGTASSDFPFTPGAYTGDDGYYVATLDETTGQVIAIAQVGGSKSATARAIAADAFGNVYVSGLTASPDYPTTPGAFQETFSPSLGAPDAFISCFDPDLTTLRYSTFFGGNNHEQEVSLSVGSSGLVTISGITGSTFFPTTPGAFDTQLAGPQGTYDGMVARFSRDLKRLYYSTFLGGTGTEWLTSGTTALAVRPDGSVVVALGTASADFPVTPDAVSTALDGVTDAVVVVMDLLPTGVKRLGLSTPGADGPLVMGVTAQPRPGSTDFALNCEGAPPSSPLGLLVVALSGLSSPVHAGGVQLWVDPATLLAIAPASSDAYGYCEFPLRVLPDPGLVGTSAAAQFLWPADAGAGGAFSASNALLLVVQP